MIQTDEAGREFKICARVACGERFGRRSNEAPSKFRGRDFCSPRCRVASNSQPTPLRRQATSETPGGFVNPDGIWRPGGFPVYPGGIEVAS
jgi:hypothetical protein